MCIPGEVEGLVPYECSMQAKIFPVFIWSHSIKIQRFVQRQNKKREIYDNRWHPVEQLVKCLLKQVNSVTNQKAASQIDGLWEPPQDLVPSK